jgi:hypothetical protein
MSHFSKLKTQMIEKAYLLKALVDLGYEFEEGDVTVTGFKGEQEPVEIRLPLKNSYDIGFRKSKAGSYYEVVADWWGVTGIKQKDFTNNLM